MKINFKNKIKLKKNNDIIVLKGKKIIDKSQELNINSFDQKKRTKNKILKFFVIIVFLGTFAGLSLGIYKLLSKEDKVVVEILGTEELSLEVFAEYEEQGIKLLINDVDVSNYITYDGKVDTNKIGKYQINYLYKEIVYAKRIINVVDSTKPIIKLNGLEEISLVETSNYKEEGATSIDNYDGDLTEKIITEGAVDTTKVGEYTVTYKVTDSSDNEIVITRKIIITAKPKEIIQKIVVEDNTSAPVVPPAQTGLITTMAFTNEGFTVNGCASSGVVPTSLSLNDIIYNITASSNCYNGTLDLSSLANGTYTLYVNNTSGKENAINKLDGLLQIKRAKIGNKLVTFDYSNSNVSLTVQDFYYEYDIVIDVGHGGWDTGATNIYNQEKNMNLIVSLYEKAKYEAAGLKVLMTRTDDTYGAGMGNFSKALYNRAYYIGYYGVTSKVVYSNHHNSSSYSGARGFEMYTSNSMSNMNTELSIFNAVSKIYKANNIYARDYMTGDLFSKAAGQVYNYKNYYGILRIPSELFNVNNITIYEACYLSSVDDYISYWNNEVWKSISDIKVEYYISKIKG